MATAGKPNASRDIRYLIYTLQTQALRALPGPDEYGDGFTLKGKRRVEDEKPLHIAIDHLGSTLDELECLIPRENRETALALVNFLMVSAHAVGSIARPSQSQKNYFSSLSSAKAGRARGKSSAKFARASWQDEALKTASAMRAEKPHLSTNKLAVLISPKLRDKHHHDTIAKFLRRQEAAGTLIKQRR